MTPRLSRVWLLVALTSSCFPAFAQTPADTPVAQPSPSARAAAPSPADEMIGQPNFPDMPLDLVLPLIEQWTGRIVLRPQALPQANISLVAKQPLTKAEAMRALETLLNLNQIALVRMGDKFIKVVALQNARGESPQLIEGSTLDLPPSGQVVSKLFQLQFLRTTEIGQMLGGLSLGNISQPVVFDKNNSVLITDTLSNLQRIESLLQKLDQPMVANLTPKFYNIHFAKASELVNKLRAMLQTQPQIGTSTNYSADDRTNQVILISDPRLQSFFDELIAKLDVKSDPNTRNEVLYLKHATAKDVAPILNQLVSGQSSKATQNTGSVQPGMVVQPNQPVAGPGAAPIGNPSVAAVVGELGSTQFSSLVNIIADDRSNALVVNGTVDDIRLIKELVDKLDIVLAQVRIEVVIAEVSLTDKASSGISSLGLDVAGNKLIGISATTPTQATGSNPSPTMSVGSSLNSSPYVNNHGMLLTSNLAATAGHWSLVGLVTLSTTPRKSNSRIISTPTITTTHNKEAKFFFGETRPVISGSTSSTAASTTTPGYNTSSITQQDIGTNLTVKPLIGNDGSVQLDIKQTISDVQDTVQVDGNTQYVMGKRETDSFITVKSNEVIVLAGMQKEVNSHSTSRLGPIPWIGDLLGARSREKSRTELVIFIRPTVLTNTAADNEEAMKTINAMPDPGAVKEKLDPKYEAPKAPVYKKLFQIP